MKPQTRVRITTKNNLVFEGVLLEGNEYTLKLDDGYNVGVHKRNVQEIIELSSHKKTSSPITPPPSSADAPVIALLHTGGTIASKVDYETGGVTNKITPNELLAMYPELSAIAQIQPVFLSQMSSDDMRFAHYNQLITAVKQAVANGAQGVIITHGTDTMHYSAAALHYGLLGVPIPVVLTGSQRSADRGSSDAATNLLGAAKFITQAGLPGVFIAMHDSSSDTDIAILRGINTRKNHSSRRDAFCSVNIPRVARIGESLELISSPPKSVHEFTPRKYRADLKIGIAFMHPQFFPDALTPYTTYDGLVVLGTGLGHAPINAIDEYTQLHAQTKDALLSLAQKIPVVMSTQCIHGRVSLHVYSPGRMLQDAGVLGHDLALTAETVFAKLAYCLSHGLDPSKELYEDVDDAIDRTEVDVYE